MKSLGRVWDKQLSCEVSRKSLGTNRIVDSFIGESGAKLDRCTVSRTGVVTSRVALKSLWRDWGPAGSI